MSSDIEVAAAAPPKTVNYKKRVLEFRDAEAIILGVGPAQAAAGVHIEKDNPRSPRICYDGGSSILMRSGTTRSMLAHLYKGERGKTMYSIHFSQDLKELRAYTPATSSDVQSARCGRPRGCSGTFDMHGSSLGWMRGRSKIYEHNGVIGTAVEDRFHDAMGKQKSREFRRAAMSAYSEAKNLGETFSAVSVKPRVVAGKSASEGIYTPSSSILDSLDWRCKVVIEMAMPTIHNCTHLYLYVCHRSPKLNGLRCPMYMAVLDYRLSRYDNGQDPLSTWCIGQLDRAGDHIIRSSQWIDDILDVARDWCAAGVDIPA